MVYCINGNPIIVMELRVMVSQRYSNTCYIAGGKVGDEGGPLCQLMRYGIQWIYEMKTKDFLSMNIMSILSRSNMGLSSDIFLKIDLAAIPRLRSSRRMMSFICLLMEILLPAGMVTAGDNIAYSFHPR